MDDALMADAKRHASETGRSLTALIQDAVAALIQRERASRSPRVIDFPVFMGDGVQPGIDITSNASIRAEMEREWPPKP